MIHTLTINEYTYAPKDNRLEKLIKPCGITPDKNEMKMKVDPFNDSLSYCPILSTQMCFFDMFHLYYLCFDSVRH